MTTPPRRHPSAKISAVRAEMARRRTAPPDPAEVRKIERARRPADKVRAAIDTADSAMLRAALAAVVDACTLADGRPNPAYGDVIDAVGVALGTRKVRRGGPQPH